MPGSLATNWLDAILYGSSTGGAAGSGETTNTLGTAVADLQVPPTQYHVGNLRIENMRQLLLAISADLKGGTRLRVRKQTANPFGATESGFYIDTSGVAYKVVDGTPSTLGGGGSTTLAAAYASGASQTDSTVSLDSTRLGVRIRDAASPITGSLFQVQSNAGSSTFLDISASSSQALRSGVADGASAVAALSDTTTSWVTTGAKLWSWRSNASEQMAITKLASAWTLDFTGIGSYRTGTVDGASAVAHQLDTSNAFSTTGAKLLSVRTAAAEKLSLAKLAADWALDYAGIALLRGGQADGASAIGAYFDTANAFSTTGAKIASFRTATAEKLSLAKTAVDWTLDFAVTGSFRSGQALATGAAYIFDTVNAYNATTNPFLIFRTNSQTAGAIYTDTTGLYFQGYNQSSSAAGTYVKCGLNGAAVTIGNATSLVTLTDLGATLGSSSLRWTEVWARRHAGVQPADIANAASVTVTIANGEYQRCLTGATAMTINGQAGFAGEILTVAVVQDATGSRSASFASGSNNFRLAGGAFTPSTGANKIDELTFRWDTSTTTWMEISRAMNL